MKFKIILVIGFLAITSFFVLFTKRRTFYSISGGKEITEDLFRLNCEQVDGESDGDRKLILNFSFINSFNYATIKEFKVIPVINGKDTLNLKSVEGIHRYSFSFPANGANQLNLFISYKIDSAGMLTNESKKYYNLDKVHTYRFKVPFQ